MSKPKLTGWYPPSVKPVRDGVYMIRVSGTPVWFRLFKNGHWYCGRSSVDFAACAEMDEKLYPSEVNERWRGLASNPEKSK